MSGQRRIADVQVGDDLPEMIKRVDRTELFLYSAASFNPHRIHYDRAYAEHEGHADILVHGPLQGSWLAQFLLDWAGPLGRLTSLSWQNRASAFPDQDLHLGARVTAVDTAGGDVTLEVWERTADGQLLMPGTATVRLPT